jgi:hypothetical protein
MDAVIGSALTGSARNLEFFSIVLHFARRYNRAVKIVDSSSFHFFGVPIVVHRM